MDTTEHDHHKFMIDTLVRYLKEYSVIVSIQRRQVLISFNEQCRCCGHASKVRLTVSFFPDLGRMPG